MLALWQQVAALEQRSAMLEPMIVSIPSYLYTKKGRNRYADPDLVVDFADPVRLTRHVDRDICPESPWRPRGTSDEKGKQ